jgi:hypothetical protein
LHEEAEVVSSHNPCPFLSLRFPRCSSLIGRRRNAPRADLPFLPADLVNLSAAAATDVLSRRCSEAALLMFRPDTLLQHPAEEDFRFSCALSPAQVYGRLQTGGLQRLAAIRRQYRERSARSHAGGDQVLTRWRLYGNFRCAASYRTAPSRWRHAHSARRLRGLCILAGDLIVAAHAPNISVGWDTPTVVCVVFGIVEFDSCAAATVKPAGARGSHACACMPKSVSDAPFSI